MLVCGDAGHPHFVRSSFVHRACAVALALPLAWTSLPAFSKTPGAVHCYGQWCHRVSTLDEMSNMVGRTGYLKASYYDDCRVDRFNTCNLTSSGEVFRPDSPDNAASPIFPDGTVILVYYPVTQKAAVLRVNSAGPYHSDRRLDVSRATADKLGFRKQGVAELLVTVIKAPEPDEARYKKLRRYSRVPGYMGMFATFDAAHEAALANLEMNFGVVMSALDEGETTPLPPPEKDTDGIGNIVARELEAVAPKPLPSAGAAEPIAETGVKETLRDGPAGALQLAPGAGGLLRHATPANAASEPAPASIAPVVSREPVGSHADVASRDETLAGASSAAAAPVAASPLVEVAALEMGGDISLVPPPDLTIVARDKQQRALVEIELSAGGQGVANVIEIARLKARAGLPKRAPAETVSLSWQERIGRFFADARLKAREGVTGAGPLTRLTAELRIKAQPPRFARD